MTSRTSQCLAHAAEEVACSRDMDMRTTMIAIVMLGAGLAWPAAARAECVGAQHLDAGPVPVIQELGGTVRRDPRGRMVTPVMVNGHGPFRFIVDTGANRSALSPRVAAALGLIATGSAAVHSIHQVVEAPVVDVQSISYGGLRFASSSLPVLEGVFLGGEDGLMGIDGMRGQRMRMDFERRCIEITPALTAPPLRGWTAVRGRLQFGGLVLVRRTHPARTDQYPGRHGI